MEYDVITVPDHDLPEGVDRVIVERWGKNPLLIVTETVDRQWRFMKAWEARVESDTTRLVRVV